MAFGFATSSRSDFVHHMHIMAPRLRCRKGKSGLEDRQIVHLGQGTPTHEIIQRINGKVGQRTPSWCPQIEHGIYRYPQTVFLGKRFGDALLDFKRAYMWLAISKLRFI